MLPQTLGELKASGYQKRSVKRELRDNTRRMLAAGKRLFPGVLGYERTVIPGIINALLAEHDFILLGLRGQAKTRILRALTDFLDPEIPVLAGSELNDDPLDPISTWGQRVVAEQGDRAAVEGLPREARYNEKLATPDVSIADLLGDIDPIKAATRRLTYADPEVIHFGIIARTNRGIFAITELPDLAPRIQVGLLNILEERDLQIRGFPVRVDPPVPVHVGQGRRIADGRDPSGRHPVPPGVGIADHLDGEVVGPPGLGVGRRQVPVVIRLVVDQPWFFARNDHQHAVRMLRQRQPCQEIRVRPERVFVVVLEAVHRGARMHQHGLQAFRFQRGRPAALHFRHVRGVV